MFIEEKEAYKNFMKLMKDFMKTQGFTNKGNNFYKRHPEGNIGVISFQKAKYSIATFYINVGVYSVSLAEFFLGEYAYKKKEVKTHPIAVEGHWWTRIENFAWEGPDHERVKEGKWSCSYDTDIEALATEVSYLIATYAIPSIDEEITDQQILDRWFSSDRWRNFSTWDLRYLAALALKLSEHGRLRAVMTEFKKRLPKYSETVDFERMVRADYHRIVKEAGLEKEGF